MKKILKPIFYNRPVVKVAEELVGKYLVRRIGRKEIALMITETEAYDGEKDLACHASKGRTARTEVMYGKPGYWYVYLIYGMYEMLNIVTGPKDYPAAVLIRGGLVEDVEGHRLHLNGPGKLTRFLEIDRRLNKSIASTSRDGAAELWIEDRGEKIKKSEILRTPRIGINYAGEKWIKKPWRFVLNKKRIKD